MPYNICKSCGAHLDSGEKCDCNKDQSLDSVPKLHDSLLDHTLIDRCNNVSNFNSGDNIAGNARESLKRFDELISTYLDSLNPEQLEYVEQRRNQWTGLVVEVYNDELSRRANYVPITVAGASNYPAESMRKRLESLIKSSEEGARKIEAFLANTEKGIKNLVRPEDAINAYRTGQCSDPILSDDEYAIEKLTAKLEYLTEQQTLMKSANAYYRKKLTMKGYSNLTNEQARAIDNSVSKRHSWERQPYPAYLLTNNNAMIKSTRQRLTDLQNHREAKRFHDFEFIGGKVVANYDIDRLQILFDSKPDEEVRQKLHSNAFRWSSKETAWQRQLTANAVRAATLILGVIYETA